MSDATQPTDSFPTQPRPEGKAPLHGLLAEYATPSEILAASRKVRDAGFSRWDTFTPFPVHGIDKAMGIKMTILPWFVLVAGLTGLASAILLQWWTNSYDYPWIISGKPFWSIPANVPIMFEMTVLFAGLTTLIGMLVLNNLPLPSHPLDFVRRFARSTDDRFFLLVEAADPKFDEETTKALLDGTHPLAVESVLEDRTTPAGLPTGLVYALVILAVASLVPFAFFAKARYATSSSPRIHAIGDMDWQPKYKAQRGNPIFADGRADRVPDPGTVAVGELHEDDHFYRGKLNDAWARTFPPSLKLDEQLMARGKERFGIYCAPCHGLTGEGDGMIARRAESLQQGTWVAPTNVTQEHLRQMPVGELFNTITHGVRNMPAYASQIAPADRWAIVLYLRALQRSRAGKVADLSPADQRGLN
jgi:mono/diheme cytochrome c family protein